MDNQYIENKLLSKNTRPTSMRILVYDLLASQNAALSLHEIEGQFSRADRVTIYRTLKTFEEKGIIHSIQESHVTKYKLCNDECNEHTHRDSHLHFYCKICKETTCREDVMIPISRPSSFIVDEIRLYARGTCEKCLQKNNE